MGCAECECESECVSVRTCACAHMLTHVVPAYSVGFFRLCRYSKRCLCICAHIGNTICVFRSAACPYPHIIYATVASLKQLYLELIHCDLTDAAVRPLIPHVADKGMCVDIRGNDGISKELKAELRRRGLVTDQFGLPGLQAVSR